MTRLARWVAGGRYVASVRGGSVWVMRRDGRALAVITVTERRGEGRSIVVGDAAESLAGAAVHFDYAATGTDPDKLAATLRRDPSLATRRAPE